MPLNFFSFLFQTQNGDLTCVPLIFKRMSLLSPLVPAVLIAFGAFGRPARVRAARATWTRTGRSP
jgi:hypothetical protein